MGVSGCGKSTLGTFLSEKLGWPLYEGDDFHPRENLEKMARGVPLTDQDRIPWLLQLHDVVHRERSAGSNAIVVCSALRRLYRQVLLFGSGALTSCPTLTAQPTLPDVWFLFLDGSYEFILDRMVARKGHFMPADLLRSQFEALEPPSEGENALTLDICRSMADIVIEIEKHLLSICS